MFISYSPKKYAMVNQISSTQYRVKYTQAGEYKITCSVVASTGGSVVDMDTAKVDVNQRK